MSGNFLDSRCGETLRVLKILLVLKIIFFSGLKLESLRLPDRNYFSDDALKIVSGNTCTAQYDKCVLLFVAIFESL